MGIAAKAQSIFQDVGGPGNPMRRAWDRLSALPGGKRLYSGVVGQLAPYTGSIGAQIITLRDGYCETEMPDRRKVRNHLKSIHAIALVNLAELTGNMALIYSLPPDARFIVAGIQIDYVKKARGTIFGTSECPVPSDNRKATYQVPVVLTDQRGDVVARARLESLVGPKSRS